MRPFRTLLADCFNAKSFEAFLHDNLADIREIEGLLPRGRVVCNFCGRERDLTEFYKHPKGRFTKCKACVKKYNKRRQQKPNISVCLKDSYLGF